MVARSKYVIFKQKVFSAIVTNATAEPKTAKEAIKNSQWLHAMQSEFSALQKNDTWSLVPPTADHILVGNKWLFKVKKNTNGSVNRFKAKLVARGYTQIPRIDFYSTYSPVIKSSTIRVVLSIAASFNWGVRQLDINNAFLHGELTETVYMPQPEGFVDVDRASYVCKLNKAIYGLRQSPRTWFDRLKAILIQWNFQNSKADTSLFVYQGQSLVYVLIYVDDILITGNSNTLI
ncbi:hypothetical protein Scep_027680 [Stephania cephalantha]|uniref:Reverse transcriptase Ty1/copia-type domain-containing protein n=1 Tax=Stephania cephalantha TaxID=152367 RepID=A0AAP0EFW1_9MAGN